MKAPINIGQHLSFIIAVRQKQRLWSKVLLVGALFGAVALTSLFLPVSGMVGIALGMVAVVVLTLSATKLARFHRFRMKARNYLAENAPLTA